MDRFVIRMTDVCGNLFPENKINFQACSGEITAVIGNNGEGKTTLANILAGNIPRQAGEIRLNDTLLDIHSISSAHRQGIYMMQETLQLFPDKNIMDNLLFGIETQVFGNRLLAPAKARKETVCRDILKILGLELDLEQLVNHLSLGEQYLLQIGRILLCHPKILIMDEFSSALTNHETRRIMQLLIKLKQENICIILISHKYDSVIRFSDRIAVVERSRIAESYSREELGDEAFIKSIFALKKNFSYPKLPHPTGDVLLSAEHISCGIIRDVSFSLREGEILGIAGLVGSGRTTLIQGICKERQITTGHITYAPVLERRGAISILPGTSSQNALFLGKDIAFNITASNVKKGARNHLLSNQKLDIYARDYMDRLSIHKDSCHIPVTSLSHGEQQKVLIARSLHQNARLYIFDDPSSTLDMTSKSELYNIYNALLARGASIILISSSFSELIGMSDRILLLKSGEQVGLYPAAQITTDFLYSVLS